MLLTNGRIYTMDASGPIVDTLLVRDGRIRFAGRRSDMNAPAAEATVDLGGRAVLPGLVDGHGHLMHLARLRLMLDLTGLASEEAVARNVAAAAARAAPDEWITGFGWDQTRWPGGRFPTRAALDRLAPGHPVALTRVDGHATWANSPALRAAGITRLTPEPEGGRIVKDARGEPTGLLIDAAQRLVQAVQPPAPADQMDRAVGDAIAECLSKGLTGVHEMGVDLRALACYRRLVERGRFPFRNHAAVAVRDVETWEHYRTRGPETLGDGQVVVGAVKLWLDGALGSRGAALQEPYCDDPDNRGLVLIPPDELARLAREATARGFQVCVHAIGDRANTLTLDTFEMVLGERPAGPAPFRVEHAQILDERDIPRFARLGVVPSMQASHCTSDMRWAPERLGPDRLRGAYAWRSLLATGATIAGGSDFPVEDPNPFLGIYAAVTRRPPTGEDSGWQPEQRMTREEAVRSFTAWNAAAAGRQGEMGTLTAGRRADLVVLDDDVFECAEERIKAIRPVLTMVGGAIVWGAPPVADRG